MAAPWCRAINSYLPKLSAMLNYYKRITLIQFLSLQKPPIDKDEEGEIIEELRGHVEFKNVTFHYPTRPEVKVKCFNGIYLFEK